DRGPPLGRVLLRSTAWQLPQRHRLELRAEHPAVEVDERDLRPARAEIDRQTPPPPDPTGEPWCPELDGGRRELGVQRVLLGEPAHAIAQVRLQRVRDGGGERLCDG